MEFWNRVPDAACSFQSGVRFIAKPNAHDASIRPWPLVSQAFRLGFSSEEIVDEVAKKTKELSNGSKKGGGSQ
jgi:hypothetical protein